MHAKTNRQIRAGTGFFATRSCLVAVSRDSHAGPADGPIVLLLHGQPTWSFLYRHVIGVLADAGLRVIARDNIGFGRSDKPAEPTDYTFARHVDWMHSLVTGLDLSGITMVVQDWGGPIGLSVLAREPDRFARVVATNTILHTCDANLAGHLDAGVLAGYDAPFPDRSCKAGLRQLTALVPLTRTDPGAAIGRETMAVLAEWEKPFLTAYSRSGRPRAHHDRRRRPLRAGAAGRAAGPNRGGIHRDVLNTAAAHSGEAPRRCSKISDVCVPATSASALRLSTTKERRSSVSRAATWMMKSSAPARK